MIYNTYTDKTGSNFFVSKVKCNEISQRTMTLFSLDYLKSSSLILPSIPKIHESKYYSVVYKF